MCRGSIPGWNTRFMWKGEVCESFNKWLPRSALRAARPHSVVTQLTSSQGTFTAGVVQCWSVSIVWPNGRDSLCRPWQDVRVCCWRGVIANSHLLKGARYCLPFFTAVILYIIFLLVCFMFLWPCIVSKAWRGNTNKMQQFRYLLYLVGILSSRFPFCFFISSLLYIYIYIYIYMCVCVCVCVCVVFALFSSSVSCLY